MAQICVEIAYLFDKRLKNAENDIEIWEMAKIFWKWLRYMGHGFSISEAALLSSNLLKKLTNGLNMWEMTYIFGKWLKYLRNG